MQIQKENQVERKTEFKTMMNFFNSQSFKRHEEMMGLIGKMSKNGSKTKRMRTDEDSD